MSKHEHEEKQKRVTCCTFVWVAYVVIFYGLEIGFGVNGLNECVTKPVDLGAWMIVSGTIGLVFSFLLLFPKLDKACGCCYALFGLAWFIVGAYCLFYEDNLNNCHVENDSQMTWGSALFFWLMTAFSIAFGVCCFCCIASITGILAGLGLASLNSSKEESYTLVS